VPTTGYQGFKKHFTFTDLKTFFFIKSASN
jgi:hypothetical protein